MRKHEVDNLKSMIKGIFHEFGHVSDFIFNLQVILRLNELINQNDPKNLSPV